jgi:hypothetical protein
MLVTEPRPTRRVTLPAPSLLCPECSASHSPPSSEWLRVTLGDWDPQATLLFVRSNVSFRQAWMSCSLQPIPTRSTRPQLRKISVAGRPPSAAAGSFNSRFRGRMGPPSINDAPGGSKVLASTRCRDDAGETQSLTTTAVGVNDFER